MRFDIESVTVALLLLSSDLSPALAHPQPIPITDVQLVERDTPARLDERGEELWKRKGGGGGKGGGGSSSGGKGGSSGSSSGSSSSGKGGSGSTGKGSSSSSVGGSTKTGSGVTPRFGGGRYYGGGATTPYASGVRSPLGLTPVLLGATALALLPGLWIYGAYSYPYTHPYTFRNHTATSNITSKRDDSTGVNETRSVNCLCAQYQECSCDDSGNTTFLDELIGNGSYQALNQSLVTVADVNGTSTILINGTLPNGTTASGGTENASAAVKAIVEASGYWAMIALVGCTVLLV
jgi:hypothetical protein